MCVFRHSSLWNVSPHSSHLSDLFLIWTSMCVFRHSLLGNASPHSSNLWQNLWTALLYVSSSSLYLLLSLESLSSCPFTYIPIVLWPWIDSTCFIKLYLGLNLISQILHFWSVARPPVSWQWKRGIHFRIQKVVCLMIFDTNTFSIHLSFGFLNVPVRIMSNFTIFYASVFKINMLFMKVFSSLDLRSLTCSRDLRYFSIVIIYCRRVIIIIKYYTRKVSFRLGVKIFLVGIIRTNTRCQNCCIGTNAFSLYNNEHSHN